MRSNHEIDKVKLYNFMKKNDVTYGELSKMLGKAGSYISQIMTGRMNPSAEVYEKLADLMEIEEGDLYAKPNSPYSRVKEDPPAQEERPGFEERMENMIMSDKERREKFFSSQAFKDEMSDRCHTYTEPDALVEESECCDDDPVIESADEKLRRRVESLTNFLSQAIVNGRRYIGTRDLVNILLG